MNDGCTNNLAKHFSSYILDGIPALKQRAYNPTLFLQMVENHGSVLEAAKALLSDPRHTSYGFQRLYAMQRLDASVEYAACLPWFRELFTDSELDEAETRLVAHDFPLAERIEAGEHSPPDWIDDLPDSG